MSAKQFDDLTPVQERVMLYLRGGHTAYRTYLTVVEINGQQMCRVPTMKALEKRRLVRQSYENEWVVNDPIPKEPTTMIEFYPESESAIGLIDSTDEWRVGGDLSQRIHMAQVEAGERQRVTRWMWFTIMKMAAWRCVVCNDMGLTR
jgi:hypothetical protein